MMKVCSGEGRGMSEANRKQGAMSERLATDENRRFEARNPARLEDVRVMRERDERSES